jgi:hypothetical protein
MAAMLRVFQPRSLNWEKQLISFTMLVFPLARPSSSVSFGPYENTLLLLEGF